MFKNILSYLSDCLMTVCFCILAALELSLPFVCLACLLAMIGNPRPVVALLAVIAVTSATVWFLCVLAVRKVCYGDGEK